MARFGLVVSDLAAAARFFTEAFDAVAGPGGTTGESYGRLMGLPDSRSRRIVLHIGAQEVALVAFEPAGRPNPAGSTSSDLWFQHFAIIVSDMDAAHRRLQGVGGFTPITLGGPITLPQSSGGVQAFKFRDGDGHPLELLAFPAGKAPDAWTPTAGRLFLGIDHSAIAVADTAASAAFLSACFGLTQSMRSENIGPEQATMDAVENARVTVTGMAPEQAPPHVELLGYHVGRRRPIDGQTRADDIAASFFVLETADLAPIIESLTARGATFVSPGIVTLEDGTRAIAVLDPDGHRFVIEERASS